MSESDAVRVARVGLEAARRRLRVEIVRDDAVYRVSCCPRTFVGLTSAEVHVLGDECAALNEQGVQ